MKSKEYLLPLIFLFSIVYSASSQMAESDFEKKYLDFHEKWDAGYDASLAEIDSIFKDCPDLKHYPHYFLYKGDWMRFAGNYDLALNYYLIAQKYIELGYEHPSIYDHRPIMYFKLGYTYYELDSPNKLKENIEKGRAYLRGTSYDFQNEVLFTELEAFYLFHYVDRKSQAMDLLEAIYAKSKLYPESKINTVIGRIRLRVVKMALEIKDYERAKRVLNEAKLDPWFKSVNGDYQRWYYATYRDYHYHTGDYEKSLKYNDSIQFTSPLELEDKEGLFENYTKLYNETGSNEIAEIYKDSLNDLLKIQRKKRIESSVVLTEENDKYKKLVSSLTVETKKTKWYWGISIAISALVLLVIIFWYGKRRRKAKKELLRERQKVELLNNNYQQVLKNYQFTTKQLEKIKHTLVMEIQKNKSPEIIALHKSISNNINSNFNEKLLSINKLRDQFMLNLREQFPDLTNYESLICFYTKMGLSAKEISQITNLTVRSIQSHQYRIGQKTKKRFDSKLKDFLEKVPLTMF